MTDTERERINAICEVAGVADIDDLSDGFHTFKQLYYQRMILFAAIVKQNNDRAWKSLRHEDGELCFGGGWFIVGIDTPEGSYTYHYENKYFDLFDCEILDYGKHWDGHTEKDVTRLLSLQPEERTEKRTETHACDLISRQAAIDGKISIQCANGVEIYSDEAVPVEYLKALPSAQPEQRWIPCSERLPEESGYYIITAHDGVGHRTTFVKYQKKAKSWGLTGARSYWRVIAWMPLPEPYQEGEQE